MAALLRNRGSYLSNRAALADESVERFNADRRVAEHAAVLRAAAAGRPFPSIGQASVAISLSDNT